MPPADVILNALVTLLVTVDPVGNVPIFLGLTAGMTAADRRAVALRGVLIAFGILVLFAITGTLVLDAMGISIDAFRVAGGLLLFYTAFEMIHAKRQEREMDVSRTAIKDRIANIAVFPLAIPLIAGPGTISATILLSSEFSGFSGATPWTGKLLLVAIIGLLIVVTAAALMAAEFFDKVLGDTGRKVLTRLLGVLLAALSVQYVADGATRLFSH